MELREWLIILGLGLVTIIVLDGVRRFQRQRNVPRLDQMSVESRSVGNSSVERAANKNATDAEGAENKAVDDKDAADKHYDAAVDWELPNGGARVVRPAQQDSVPSKPKLKRQEHPGPSRVLSEFRQRQNEQNHVGQGRDGRSADVDLSAESLGPQADIKNATQVAADRSDESADSVDRAVGSEAVDNAVDKSTARSSVDEELAAPELSDQELVDQYFADQEHAESIEPTVSPYAAQTNGEEAELDGSEPSGSRPDERRAGEAPTKRDPHDSLYAEPEDHEDYDEEDYRLVDIEGMGHSFKEGSKRMGTSMHRFGSSLQRSMSERRQQKRTERQQRQAEKEENARLKAREEERRRAEDEARAVRDAERREQEAEARVLREERLAALRTSQGSESDRLEARERAQHMAEKAEDEAALSQSLQAEYEALYGAAGTSDDHWYDESAEQAVHRDEAPQHPVLEKTLRTAIESEHARDTLSEADEVIIISVMSRDGADFSGATLLNLMLACGLRYAGDMGIFHRFETEELTSNLQFSMVNAVKPGTFPIYEMDNFHTPGITLLMPLPGAEDTTAAFEAMVETAMVIVRHLGGELKDENQSVMTAQTVEFSRQRVHEFERRHRLRRHQAN